VCLDHGDCDCDSLSNSMSGHRIPTATPTAAIPRWYYCFITIIVFICLSNCIRVNALASEAHAADDTSTDSAAAAETGHSTPQRKWQLLSENDDSQFTRFPTVRYAHSAVSIGRFMYISHGYFYNRRNHKPTWLGDTWKCVMMW
jgi:hypothetical protein